MEVTSIELGGFLAATLPAAMGLGTKMRSIRGNNVLPITAVRSRKVAPAPHKPEPGKVLRAKDPSNQKVVCQRPIEAVGEKRSLPSDGPATNRSANQPKITFAADSTRRRPAAARNNSPQRRRPRSYDVVKEVALAQASINNSRRKIEAALADLVPQRTVLMGNLVAVVGEYFVASERSFEIFLRDIGGAGTGSILDEDDPLFDDDDDEISLGSALSALDDDIFDAVASQRVHHFTWRKDILRPAACGMGMCIPFGVSRCGGDLTKVEL